MAYARLVVRRPGSVRRQRPRLDTQGGRKLTDHHIQFGCTPAGHQGRARSADLGHAQAGCRRQLKMNPERLGNPRRELVSRITSYPAAAGTHLPAGTWTRRE